jgi:hypothetical protein
MRWDARPLRLWSMDYRIQNGRCPAPVLLMTTDCNLKIWNSRWFKYVFTSIPITSETLWFVGRAYR